MLCRRYWDSTRPEPPACGQAAAAWPPACDPAAGSRHDPYPPESRLSLRRYEWIIRPGFAHREHIWRTQTHPRNRPALGARNKKQGSEGTGDGASRGPAQPPRGAARGSRVQRMAQTGPRHGPSHGRGAYFTGYRGSESSDPRGPGWLDGSGNRDPGPGRFLAWLPGWGGAAVRTGGQ